VLHGTRLTPTTPGRPEGVGGPRRVRPSPVRARTLAAQVAYRLPSNPAARRQPPLRGRRLHSLAHPRGGGLTQRPSGPLRLSRPASSSCCYRIPAGYRPLRWLRGPTPIAIRSSLCCASWRRLGEFAGRVSDARRDGTQSLTRSGSGNERRSSRPGAGRQPEDPTASQLNHVGRPALRGNVRSPNGAMEVLASATRSRPEHDVPKGPSRACGGRSAIGRSSPMSRGRKPAKVGTDFSPAMSDQAGCRGRRGDSLLIVQRAGPGPRERERLTSACAGRNVRAARIRVYYWCALASNLGERGFGSSSWPMWAC